jgi:hypothetical protein
MAEKRLVRSERKPNLNYDLLETDAGPAELYVDGFVGQTIGSSVIKINLYTAIEIKTEGNVPVEQRMLTLRLVMPTGNFIEMCVNTLTSLSKKSKVLHKMLAEHQEKILKALSTIGPSEPGKEK